MSNLLCIEDTKSPSHVYLICNFLETNRALGSNTTISLGNLPNVDPFHDCYGSVAETYPLAEGLDAFRSSSVCRQRYVLTVGLVEQDRPSFHGGSSHITLCYKKKKKRKFNTVMSWKRNIDHFSMSVKRTENSRSFHTNAQFFLSLSITFG